MRKTDEIGTNRKVNCNFAVYDPAVRSCVKFVTGGSITPRIPAMCIAPHALRSLAKSHVRPSVGAFVAAGDCVREILMSFVSVQSKTGSSPARAGQPEICLSACLEGGIPLPVQLLELARMDLTFLTDRPLRFGTPVQVAIFSDFVSSIAQNKAFVHWCRPHAQGWQVGAFLTQPLPDRLTSHEWNDLRSTLRYDCNWKAWALWGESGVLESIQIQNYSITGMRLVKDTAVLPEMEFSLFGSAGRRDRAVVKGKVQWCRPVEGFFHVGALIHGQKGRDLPRIFGNLDAVHVDSSQPCEMHSRESHDTLRCEQELMERFLPSEGSTARRNHAAPPHLDGWSPVGNS